MCRLEIEWRVPKNSRRRWLGGKSSQVAHVVDVSVTGAAIEAPFADDLFFGQRIAIRYDGLQGTVVIRRAEATDDAKIVRYGVEFLHLDTGLYESLHAILETSRPTGLETRWSQAH